MAVGTTAAVLGGASLAGGIASGVGAHKAGQAQAGAAKDAAQLQHRQFQQTREDFAPFRQTGTQALFSLADLTGVPRPASMEEGAPIVQGDRVNALEQFFTSPGFEFRRDQGIQAIENANSARGMLNSGANMKDLTRFGQGLASQEFGNFANRLAALSGVGQTATRNTGSLGADAAFRQGNALQNAGMARASGFAGMGNAFNSTLNNMGGIFGMQQAGLFDR